MITTTTRPSPSRRPNIVILWILLSLLSITTHAARVGEACQSDADCDGNLDCVRISFFPSRYHCYPVTCAKGATHALLEHGFDPDRYLTTLRGGLRNRDFFLGGGAEAPKSVEQKLYDDPPPMHVFKANYSACLNPPQDDQAANARQYMIYTGWGFQMSGGFLFSYNHKFSLLEYYGETIKVGSRCAGGLVGCDFGLDMMLQVLSEDRRDDPLPEHEDPLGRRDDKKRDFRSTYYVPLATLGPIGVKLGWFNADGLTGVSFLEMTVGPSMGINFLGLEQCFNNAETYEYP